MLHSPTMLLLLPGARLLGARAAAGAADGLRPGGHRRAQHRHPLHDHGRPAEHRRRPGRDGGAAREVLRPPLGAARTTSSSPASTAGSPSRRPSSASATVALVGLRHRRRGGRSSGCSPASGALNRARLLFFALLLLVDGVQLGLASYLFSIMALPAAHRRADRREREHRHRRPVNADARRARVRAPRRTAAGRSRSFPLGATRDAGRGQLQRLLARAPPRWSCCSSTASTTPQPSRVVALDPQGDRTEPLLARLRAGARRRAALRLPRARAVRPGARAPVRPAEGPASTPTRGRSPCRRATAGSRRAPPGDNAAVAMKSVVVDRARLRLGGRPPAAPPLREDDHLRDARRRLHPPPQLGRRRRAARAPTPG